MRKYQIISNPDLTVGKNNKQFKMIKLRSMVVDADSSGVDSTSSNDNRITKIGHIIRKFKLDELTQLPISTLIEKRYERLMSYGSI